MKINNLIKIISCLILLVVINSIIFLKTNNDFLIILLLSVNIILPIVVLILKLNNSIMFDPVNLFSIFYLFVPITGYYFSFIGLRNNQYIYSVLFYNDIDYLFKITLLYSFIFYVLFVFSCEIVMKSNKSKVNFQIETKALNLGLIYVLSIIFLFLGFFNLIYNVFSTSGGDIFHYIKNIVSRSKEFKESGTTILYHFSYVSIYMYIIYCYCKNRKLSTDITFYFLLFITLFMKFSTGRITNTLFFIMSLIALTYLLKLSDDKSIKNSKYYLTLVPLGIMGVLFYSFRIVSSYLSYGMNMSFVDSVKMVIDDFGFYAIDKGNLPNIPIIMKIIDSWNNDIGYLWGRSYLSVLQSLVQTDYVKTSFPIVSISVKDTWYSNVLGGALPPSIMGEAYANFGILGILIFPILFGLIVGLFYKFVLNKRSIWLHIICVQILVGFIFIAPKVESTNLSPWFIIPTLIAFLSYSILNFTSKTNKSGLKE